MDLKNIYVGMPVKTTKDETLEVIRIDEYTETIFCNPIGTQNADIKEFNINELQEL